MLAIDAEIANEEAIGLPPTDMSHAIWTPYDAYDAAATLLHVLNEDQAAVA